MDINERILQRKKQLQAANTETNEEPNSISQEISKITSNNNNSIEIYYESQETKSAISKRADEIYAELRAEIINKVTQFDAKPNWLSRALAIASLATLNSGLLFSLILAGAALYITKLDHDERKRLIEIKLIRSTYED